MEMKKNNECYDYAGFCDDWDTETHESQYDPNCKICGNAFQDGEEFLELPCTHVEHTQCIMTKSWGQDHTCSECN